MGRIKIYTFLYTVVIIKIVCSQQLCSCQQQQNLQGGSLANQQNLNPAGTGAAQNFNLQQNQQQQYLQQNVGGNLGSLPMTTPNVASEITLSSGPISIGSPAQIPQGQTVPYISGAVPNYYEQSSIAQAPWNNFEVIPVSDGYQGLAVSSPLVESPSMKGQSDLLTLLSSTNGISLQNSLFTSPQKNEQIFNAMQNVMNVQKQPCDCQNMHQPMYATVPPQSMLGGLSNQPVVSGLIISQPQTSSTGSQYTRPPPVYPAAPVASSSSSTTSSGKGSKSSKLSSLIPLVIDLLKDKNSNCGCGCRCPNCGCMNNCKPPPQMPKVFNGYPNQSRFASLHDQNIATSESEEDSAENTISRRNRRKNKKSKKPKIDSDEDYRNDDDYSDED